MVRFVGNADILDASRCFSVLFCFFFLKSPVPLVRRKCHLRVRVQEAYNAFYSHGGS